MTQPTQKSNNDNNMDPSTLPDLLSLESWTSRIDLHNSSFQWAAFLIAFQPIWWNIVARLEYHTHFLTKIFMNNKYWGCYFLAFMIFTTSFYRDWGFEQAMLDQPTFSVLAQPIFQGLAVLLMVIGSIFVLSSMWRLGVAGTYLGDYFGILFDSKVTGFPFNILNDPMYMGATMVFLGKAIWSQSPIGVVLSAIIFVVYRIALIFEGSFTNYIYSQREKTRSKRRN